MHLLLRGGAVLHGLQHGLALAGILPGNADGYPFPVRLCVQHDLQSIQIGHVIDLQRLRQRTARLVGTAHGDDAVKAVDAELERCGRFNTDGRSRGQIRPAAHTQHQTHQAGQNGRHAPNRSAHGCLSALLCQKRFGLFL